MTTEAGAGAHRQLRFWIRLSLIKPKVPCTPAERERRKQKMHHSTVLRPLSMFHVSTDYMNSSKCHEVREDDSAKDRPQRASRQFLLEERLRLQVQRGASFL